MARKADLRLTVQIINVERLIVGPEWIWLHFRSKTR